MKRLHRLRFLAALPIALSALPTHAQSPEALPRLHVLRVNETSANALAGARLFAGVQVDGCRAAMGLPPAGEPALPDAALAKVVYNQEESFFDGDRRASYVTRRFILADRSSSCAPYLLVQREVTIVDGCGTRITGGSGNGLNISPMPEPPPWKPEVRVESTGRGGDSCVRKRRKPMPIAGLPTDAAGNGPACIWQSRMFAAAFADLPHAPLPEPGAGPSAKGLDFCLYAALPYYAPAHAAEEMVVLRTHAGTAAPADPAALAAASGGHSEFETDTRLQSFESGGAPQAKFDKAAADAFVRLPQRESL